MYNETAAEGGNGDQSGEGAVRVVMRKIGNLELILNSRLFSGMACKKGCDECPCLIHEMRCRLTPVLLDFPASCAMLLCISDERPCASIDEGRGEKAVIFSGMGEQGLVTYLIRTSTPSDAANLHQHLLEHCPKS